MRQQWPWSSDIVVSYYLDGLAEGQVVDLAVSTRVGGKDVEIPVSALSGDYSHVASESEHALLIDPTKVPELVAQKSLKAFSVTLTPKVRANPDLYLIIDLTNGCQKTYLTAADICSGRYGTFETSPSWISNSSVVTGPDADCVIWTGVTNDMYKLTHFVMRRIPAGTAYLGDGTYQPRITKDFWIGVYPMTQQQYWYMFGNPPAYIKDDSRFPVDQVWYNVLRGMAPAINWPTTGSAATPTGTIVGELRTKFGIPSLDLPTEAQWEYACRAGTTTAFNNGTDSIEGLGRCQNNQGDGADGAHVQLTVVGSYLPNAWGLYDMHGNVFEWCCDWLGDSYDTTQMEDPVGLSSGTQRVLRGGAWSFDVSFSTASRRHATTPDNKGWGYQGFRLVCAAE